MESITQIVIEKIQPWKGNRAHGGLGDLKDLTASVEEKGVLKPVDVRPLNGKGSGYELLDGERRFRAAKAAKLEAIPAIIRSLNDEEALEFRAVVDTTGESCHPLDESDGYARLQKLGRTAAQIGEKIGRTADYVRSRLLLQKLSDKARKALDAGEISVGVAQVLARCPSTKLQDDALGRLTRGVDVGITVDEARKEIEQHFMHRLGGAPFDRSDATLVPGAGACTVCPHRTGNQTELFSDVKSPDVCTNPPCFEKKVRAHGQQLIKLAKKEGSPVLTAEETKKVFPKNSYSSSGAVSTSSPYRDLHAEHFDYRLRGRETTVKALLAKAKIDPTITLGTDPRSGKVHELVPASAVTRAVNALLPKPKKPSSSSTRHDKAARSKAKLEAEAQDEVERRSLAALVEAVEKTDHEDADARILPLVVEHLSLSAGYGADKAMERREIGTKNERTRYGHPALLKELKNERDVVWVRGLVAELLAGEDEQHLERLCKLFNVSLGAIKAKALAELKAKAKADEKAPAAKRGGTGKATPARGHGADASPVHYAQRRGGFACGAKRGKSTPNKYDVTCKNCLHAAGIRQAGEALDLDRLDRELSPRKLGENAPKADKRKRGHGKKAHDCEADLGLGDVDQHRRSRSQTRERVPVRRRSKRKARKG